MKIFSRRSTQLAVLVFAITVGYPHNEAVPADIRGRIVDRCSTIDQSKPCSSEMDIKILTEATGLPGSDVRVMREAAGFQSSGAAKMSSVIRDEKKTPLFESGSAVMTDAVRQRLDALAGELKGKRNIRIEITGHTDDQRISKKLQNQFVDNQVLSKHWMRHGGSFL